MRNLIAATAFLIPLLVAIAIGTAFADGGSGGSAHLPSAAFAELCDFVRAREALLDHYAIRQGQATVGAMPHLALERFNRRGCTARGQAWYRLGQDVPGLTCGVLRRAAADGPTAEIDGQTTTLVLPVTPHWSYWEVVSPPRKSP